MRKTLLFTYLAVSCLLLLPLSAGYAQTPKVAYVNSETILRELPEAQQAQAELQAVVNGWQAALDTMSKQLQEKYEDYQKKEPLLDVNVKAQKQKELQDLQQQARDFQARKFDAREGEAVKLREKKLAPIQEKVLRSIEAVAKEDGFNFVFDKAGNVSNLLYADAKFDLTYRVIDRLKRGTVSTKPKDTK